LVVVVLFSPFFSSLLVVLSLIWIFPVKPDARVILTVNFVAIGAKASKGSNLVNSMAIGLGKSLKHLVCPCLLLLLDLFFLIGGGIPNENLSIVTPPCNVLLLVDVSKCSAFSSESSRLPKRSTPVLPNVDVGGRRFIILFLTIGDGGTVVSFGGGLDGFILFDILFLIPC
jgi:hypothetical protein